MWAYENIRQERLDKTSEMGRMIASSSFAATPHFEEEYWDRIKDDPHYLALYTRWVLAFGPLPPMPTDEELYRLREDILGVYGTPEPGQKIVLDEALFALLLDMVASFFEPLLQKALLYYTLPDTNEEQIFAAAQKAAYSALFLCESKYVIENGYPYFVNALAGAFQVFLPQELKRKGLDFPEDDAAFVEVVKHEWTRLRSYSDSLYGFEVMPEIHIDAMERYLKLPFGNDAFRKLSSEPEYQEMLNYVVAMATFKPTPEPRVKAYFRQKLCSFYFPLAERLAGQQARKRGNPIPKKEILNILEDEIRKAASDFDYFFANTANLKKKKISPFSMLLIPINGVLAKLGNLFDNDEFPFTAYLTKRLNNRMRLYFADDLNTNHVSLDASDDDGILLDTLDEEKLRDNAQHIPDYDATDSTGATIGWKRDTFAGIIRKDPRTLKRWEKDGLLIPRRYEIHSRMYGPVPYRVYVREDIEKAKEAELLKGKKMRHRA